LQEDLQDLIAQVLQTSLA